MSLLILFAPGAGAPSTSEWMETWATRLATLGTVERFDYPYMRAGKKFPDKLPKLIAAHREALASARARHPGATRTALIGKSMGSRVGCHLSLEVPVDALVCFGYPLVGQNGAMRDEVLRALATPILFLQGDRDELCPLDAMARVREAMSATNELHVMPGGDHSLEVRKADLAARGTTQAALDDAALSIVARFLAANTRRD